jgi:hypothetical protein
MEDVYADMIDGAARSYAERDMIEQRATLRFDTHNLARAS